MPTEPFIVSLGASNHSLVRGCPGVPKTCPRVESVLEVRSKDGNHFLIRNITLELNTLQSVSVPSTGGFGSNDAHKAYSIYKDTVYRAPNDTAERVLGMDIPFIIPLPKDIVSSGKNSRWNAKTVHNVMVRIGWSTGSKTEAFSVSFPLIIKRYDTLPLYRQFNEPITKTVDSVDRNILVEYSLPNSSAGPKDELVLYMRIQPNSNFLDGNGGVETSKRRSFIKKKPPVFKLKKIHFELREVLVCHDQGLSSKQTKLLSKQQDFDTELGPDGITTQISFDFPSEMRSIISNSSSSVIAPSSAVKKLPLSNGNVNSSPSLRNRNSLDGYRPQLTKRLTGGFLANNSRKRKSLDLRRNRPSLSSTASIENIRQQLASENSFDSSKSDEIKPVPTTQNYGVNKNHKTLTTSTKLFEEVNAGIPLSHMQGFTTNGKLFSIKYELVFRIKIHNSSSNSARSSVKFSQPITVSPYDRIQSVKLLKWIVKEWELAQFINNTIFQTNFNNEQINYINTTTAQIPTHMIDNDIDNIADLDSDDDNDALEEDEAITDELDTTNRFLNEAVFAGPVRNNFANVSSNIKKYHQSNNNYYYDYSIGAIRDAEFESSLNKGSLHHKSTSRKISGHSEKDGSTLTIYQSKPFHVYRPQNQMDWRMLGLSDVAIGGNEIIHYID